MEMAVLIWDGVYVLVTNMFPTLTLFLIVDILCLYIEAIFIWLVFFWVATIDEEPMEMVMVQNIKAVNTPMAFMSIKEDKFVVYFIVLDS